ncbi:MAG: type II toxin-antitoxin system PemK/MazF family toxin [Acidobacteria bacterium]|nr:type II toxin-antitoxin system PemK/MazF family toxin [Acidobacteriota bacterium]MCA1637694.1 type II toxin-antitoxin system PemK/MazF family toxin [Acidobacteriota bacterium]
MTIERWEIWLANLEPVVGSEQGKTRPVLVLSSTALNQILPVVNVLPVTSRKPKRRIYPNEALISAGTAGLVSDSIVLCYQIRTLDKQRLTKRFGKLEDDNLRNQILNALKFQLEMEI